jgi:hypothetical protein
MKLCQLDSGDRLGSELKGPEWTPYATAIASYYRSIVPLYLTTQVVFNNVGGPTTVKTIMTSPYQHDVLIMGMSAVQSLGPLPIVGFPYLNITDQQTGIPWVTPSLFNFSPLPAFVGFPVPGQRTTVLKLPESFFLPKGVELKIDWIPVNLDQTPDVTVTLTMIGVQLINYSRDAQAPETVTMPNGNVIRVGSRMPWFSTVLYGRRIAGRSLNIANLMLPALEQAIQYTPPSDCNVEIHDAYASFLDNTFETGAALSSLQVKMDNTRERNDWTPMLTPTPAVFGSFLQVNPTMPFVIPKLLEKGDQLRLVEQNNSSTSPVSQGTLTFRGVRLCQY